MRIIAGSLGGRRIRTVEGPGYRPATMKVRGAIFSMLESRGIVWGGKRVLDLFAGSGSLGFEALSRGAATATFVEKARPAVACLRRNAELFGLSQESCRILEQDVTQLIRRPPFMPFDVIFVDPPYADGKLLAPIVGGSLRNGWLAGGGHLLVEAEGHLAFDGEAFSEDLTLLTDRMYGQTRIIIWQQLPA